MGDDRGGWSYMNGRRLADGFNTCFALIALHEASKAGVSVKEATIVAHQTGTMTVQPRCTSLNSALELPAPAELGGGLRCICKRLDTTDPNQRIRITIIDSPVGPW